MPPLVRGGVERMRDGGVVRVRINILIKVVFNFFKIGLQDNFLYGKIYFT